MQNNTSGASPSEFWKLAKTQTIAKSYPYGQSQWARVKLLQTVDQQTIPFSRSEGKKTEGGGSLRSNSGSQFNLPVNELWESFK